MLSYLNAGETPVKAANLALLFVQHTASMMAFPILFLFLLPQHVTPYLSWSTMLPCMVTALAPLLNAPYQASFFVHCEIPPTILLSNRVHESAILPRPPFDVSSFQEFFTIPLLG